MSEYNRPIRVGLIIDEFFGGANTAFGGYGFLARNHIAKYIPNADIQIDVLLGKGSKKLFAEEYLVDDVKLYRLPRRKWFARRWLRKKNYDIYLSVELTFNYVLENELDKRKKLVLWIQDPRPTYEWEEINTVKLFPETNYYNQKIYDLVHDWYNNGRVKFISQGYFLNQKAIDLYQLENSVPIEYMPNPIDINFNFDVKTYVKKNIIIFLGRLESVKRGWLFCEIAKRMPQYEFYVLGQTFREESKNNEIMKGYQNIDNLHFAGHVEGSEKEKFLKDAKLLINTSIHEALPISFLEALSFGTLLVSNRNPEELTSKFGIHVGDVLGDGFEKVHLYVEAIESLMENEEQRHLLAIQARKYIEEYHNVADFTKKLRNILFQEVKS
ncbi:glycosyltransferase family 4 protein [Acinetobacter sp. LMB-5]|uniref:glycosyltransferase family 4 protein n=1 Tax=Acinetobacter sp. LMB-5 TaxID=1609919 RepID=UPI000761919C|nr:glycosyltransferase family 4 protein [Acinetobacter sp. LMB-5]